MILRILSLAALSGKILADNLCIPFLAAYSAVHIFIIFFVQFSYIAIGAVTLSTIFLIYMTTVAYKFEKDQSNVRREHAALSECELPAGSNDGTEPTRLHDRT